MLVCALLGEMKSVGGVGWHLSQEWLGFSQNNECFIHWVSSIYPAPAVYK